jgi:hypothetical protein
MTECATGWRTRHCARKTRWLPNWDNLIRGEPVEYVALYDTNGKSATCYVGHVTYYILHVTCYMLHGTV